MGSVADNRRRVTVPNVPGGPRPPSSVTQARRQSKQLEKPQSSGASSPSPSQGHRGGSPGSAQQTIAKAPQAAAPPPAVNPWTSRAQNKTSGQSTGASLAPVRGGEASAAIPDLRGSGSSTMAMPPPARPSRNSSASALEFNAREVEEYLQAAYKAAAPDAVAKDATNKRASGAWGAKPGAMATGQNFWAHLSKQVADRERNAGG